MTYLICLKTIQVVGKASMVPEYSQYDIPRVHLKLMMLAIVSACMFNASGWLSAQVVAFHWDARCVTSDSIYVCIDR